MTRASLKSQILIFAALLLCALPARAQVATGLPPFGSFGGGPLDTVDNADLDVHFQIPIVNKAGRGLPFAYALIYDSLIWSPVGSSGNQVWTPVPGWFSTTPNWGWSPHGGIFGAIGNYDTYQYCYQNGNPIPIPYVNYEYWDSTGALHLFPFQLTPGQSTCGVAPVTSGSGMTSDGSGYTMVVNNWSPTVYSLSGVADSGSGLTDPNGNTISGGTDTLGVTMVTVSGNGTPSSPITYTYPTVSGSPATETVTVKYQAYTVRTNFGCSGVTEFGATSENLVSEIDLPDSSKYTFQYEPTPGYSSDTTGRISEITLPTGGTISYAYTGSYDGISCSDGTTVGLTRTLSPGGAWTYLRSYVTGSQWQTIITDPQGNQTNMEFQGIYEVQRVVYQGSSSGTLLETVDTCYNGATPPCVGTAVTPPITSRTVQVTLPNLSPSKTVTTYNYNGLPGEIDEYDWGPTLVRKTITTYTYNTSCGVTSSYVADHPCSVTVENSSGTTVASTSYSYNSSGNMLSKTPSVGPAFTFTYNSNGTVKTSADPSGTTSYSYGSNSCNAFPDTVTPPISSLATTSVWNCNGAVMTSSKDANSNPTSYAYNDPFNRLTNTTYPDGGSVTITYTSETQTTTTTKITSSVSRTDTTYLDGLGRISSKTVAGVTTNTAYDSVGRVYTQGVQNSSALDTYSYDALNRVTNVTHADSSSAQTSYSTNCATSTDEAGKARKVCTDGLGRLSSVTEDPSGLAYQTTYVYDVLNDLTGVSQASESRSYYYDGLGRITQSTTPEAGTTYYTYDSDSTCGTSAGDLVKRVNARSIRTCYAYDSMHRPTQKSYSDGTGTANYYYDQSSYNGLTISNGKGWRTGMSDGSGQTAWSYDAMGRALAEKKTIAGITETVGYTFNYDGSLASLTYPSGRTITYGVDSQGRPASAQDTTNGINYAGSATYAAQGALASVLNGKTSSFGGITYSIGYNNRLWPSSISASSSNGTALSLAYSTYYLNGNVEVITNNRDNGRTVTYGYDSLNRINSASSQATSGTDCWGQAIPSTGYDRWGNLLTINVTKCSAPALSISVNGNNQVSGFSYDAAGDVTSDGAYAYTWDAEGRMTAAGSTTYAFDGDGQRVEKSSGTLYWQGTGAPALAETDTSGNTLSEYIFFAGKRIARRDSSGNVYYYFGNHIGSPTITNASGTLCYDADFYPFGGELAFTNTCSQNYKFAGMERDPETGNDHTLFRSFRSNYGRWLSPDPAGKAAADPTNPQSWNRYTYALNNPANLIDPRGLDSCPMMDEQNNCMIPNWGSWSSQFSAAYNGGPPAPLLANVNSWLAQNTGIYDPATQTVVPGSGFAWAVAGPGAGLSVATSPGNYALGSATNLGFMYVVSEIKEDLKMEQLNRLAQTGGLPEPGDTYSDILPSGSSWYQNALALLEYLQASAAAKMPSVPQPSQPCSAIIGPTMSQWSKALQAWTKAHPGQKPPPSLTTPPDLNGACG